MNGKLNVRSNFGLVSRADLVIVDGVVKKDRTGDPGRIADADDYRNADLIIACGVVIKDTV